MTQHQNEQRRRLERMGFIIGPRDVNMNRAWTGAFMVAEAYDPGHCQDDGRGGVWCIVGDDLNKLIADAASFWGDCDGYTEELTPAGVQLLIPGCERTPPKTDKPQQLGLW